MLQIQTKQFFLRERTLEDANKIYLGRLNDATAKRCIASVATTRSLEDLSAYLESSLR